MFRPVSKQYIRWCGWSTTATLAAATCVLLLLFAPSPAVSNGAAANDRDDDILALLEYVQALDAGHKLPASDDQSAIGTVRHEFARAANHELAHPEFAALRAYAEQ